MGECQEPYGDVVVIGPEANPGGCGVLARCMPARWTPASAGGPQGLIDHDRTPRNPRRHRTGPQAATMPSIPVAPSPSMEPTEVNAPPVPTRNSSMIPLPPVSAYRYAPSADAAMSIGPGSVLATTPLAETSERPALASVV